MKIAILGTGAVGQTFADKLSSLGHAVMVGTRDVAETMARDKPDMMGNPPFSAWCAQHPKVAVGTFAEAAAHGELAFCALSGAGAAAVVKSVATQLADKILVDISNPLDFSKGFPPFLSVCNTDSLGEQIQRDAPKTKVVKTLNTVNCLVMVNPALVTAGEHTAFMSGNDAGAKAEVGKILREWFGWKDVVDLGDITTARGTEQLLPIWVRLYGALGTATFGFKVVR
ncbi:MAG TPA: NAD(P)-binding domain-containing protein [Nannocystaceae bacterium]|nr:NAD(P)-binding domain-containing protein [Nannocystaceae bacterium]